MIIFRCFLRFFHGHKVHANAVLLWIYFFILLIYSLFTENIFQVIFGTKILILFLLGISYSIDFEEHAKDWRKVTYIVTMLSVIGLVMDYFVTLPWANMVLNIGGLAKQIGRPDQVYMFEEFRRLHGFSLSPNFAAVNVAIFYILYAHSSQKWTINKFILLIVTLVAVVLTSIKSVIAALLIITICDIFRFSPRIRQKLIFMTTCIFVLLAIGIPFILSFDAKYFPRFILDLRGTPLASFAIRVMDTWPRAFTHYESPLFGGGIGSVGGAQSLFDPLGYVNGGYCDNWIVYLFLVGGVIPVIFCSGALVQATRTSESDLMPTLAAFISIYGTMESSFEVPGASFILGLVLGYAFLKPSLRLQNNTASFSRLQMSS
jgi:hypothetical protein